MHGAERDRGAPATGPALEVRELTGSQEGAWTQFVGAHPDATLYHTVEWRDFIQAVFGHRPVYLTCASNGRVRGVLPMFLVRWPFLGSKLISMPYDIGSGGALALDQDAERCLVEGALALARQSRVRFVELRCRCPQV